MAQLLLVLLLCIIANDVSIRGDTPLCDICPCNSKPNDPPHINCQKVKARQFFDESYWFDKKSNLYAIASITVKLYDVGAVFNKNFPKSNLKLLDLSESSFNAIGNGVFAQLQEMESLILGNNNIKRILPDVFLGVYVKDGYFPLKALKTLDLNSNQLRSLDADTFEHIDELEELILSNNPFEFIDASTVSAIASLVNLKILDLGNTQLKYLPHNILHMPKHLEVLNLSGNDLASVPKNVLADARSLQVLYLDYNPLGNISGPNVFPSMPTLKFLHISKVGNLEHTGPYAFGELENLQELYLTHNIRLKSLHIHSFLRPGHQNEMLLKKLSLRCNNLTYLDAVIFSRLKNLEQLDLFENALTCSSWSLLFPVYSKINKINIATLSCGDSKKKQNMTFRDVETEKIEAKRRKWMDIYLMILIPVIATGCIVVAILCVHWYHKRLEWNINDTNSNIFYDNSLSHLIVQE